MRRSSKTLTKKQMAAYCKLSTPAKRLFTRLMEGHFYPVDWSNASKYWLELLASGLVGTMGRVVKVAAYYVPAGTKPFTNEEFPQWPPMVIEPKGE